MSYIAWKFEQTFCRGLFFFFTPCCFCIRQLHGPGLLNAVRVATQSFCGK